MPHHLLLGEDNELNRHRLCRRRVRRAYSVAMDGRKAVNMAATASYYLILMDMSLRLLVILLLFLPGALRGQTPAPNRVLQLTDGKSYVELPPNIFDALTQATVEGWVRWETLDGYRRFIDFGDIDQEMYVRSDGPQLNFLIAEPGGPRHRIEVAGILSKNEWCHVAAVTGPGGGRSCISMARSSATMHGPAASPG